MLSKHKENVGKTVFTNFEKKITDNHFKKGLHMTRITAAAEIAEEKPFVTMPLRDNGILLAGERNTHLLHTFQPNLWAQDYAHTIGKLGKMTVSTAIERANASVEYILETSKNIAHTLKRTGTKEYDYYVSMREAAMIECIYKLAGVDETDGLALLHFADEIDLTDLLRELVKLDPYFNRRNRQVLMFEDINSTESVKINQTKTGAFIEELLVRVGRKHPALFKRIAKTVS